MRLAVAFLALATAAHAQDAPCLPSADQFANALQRQFGEVPEATGALPDGRALWIFANPKTGTWTVVVQDRSGAFCSPAAGDGFKAVALGQPT